MAETDASDELKEDLEAFEACAEAEKDNRADAIEDLKFGRLGEQWSPDDVKIRKGRPCLVINTLPSFMRQVYNDARQNKPAIAVKPVDDAADVETAKVLNGIIKNIEYTSSADVAYDTAAECAVDRGLGYIRVAIEYAHDDTFDKDLLIQRVANPFSVYGDPHSTAADSSDWCIAFVTDRMAKSRFRRRWKGAAEVDWDDLGYSNLPAPWSEDGEILVAERWKREEVDRKILLLSDGMVMAAEDFEKVDPETRLSPRDLASVSGVTVVRERIAKSYKVTQRIMTGAEILEDNDWAGRFIPLIPVYGEEINVEGKRHFRSLIHSAKDAQRNKNYWRSSAAELVALAPKAPWVGPTGSFKTDENWTTANTENHAFLEYDPVNGGAAPQRQPFAGIPAGALQEALNASDDMKAILGMYDASLGARSNETSGKAILVRQREGDVSTFNFVDNLTRAIRHTGRVLIDLIPKVYSGARVVRILGEKNEPQSVGVNGKQVQGQARTFDLTAGKYDLAVSTGPMYTTRREEAVAALTELLRAFPQAAPVIGDLLIKMMDFPEADEIAKRLQALAQGNNIDPAVVKKMQQEIEVLRAENARLKGDAGIDAAKVQVDAFEAQTDRMKVVGDLATSAATPSAMQFHQP